MNDILGCVVSQRLFEHWSSLFVFQQAPFFLTHATQSLLPSGAVCLTRTEFRQLSLSLDFCDSYATYAVKPEGAFVALINSDEFHAMPPELQQALLHVQWQLGRGHIYDWQTIRDILTPSEHAAAQSATFATPEGKKVALDYALWQSLSTATRWQWLAQFISEDRRACLSATLSPSAWTWIKQQHGPIIRQLAGSFAWSSGPNCFSTTLAAATPTTRTATSIASFWLHQSPFMRGLAQRGYVLNQSLSVQGVVPPGAILVWGDSRGTLHHACFVIGQGLALNKDSQAWFVPRQIVPLQTVLKNWQDEDLTVHVYTRES
jgi:hypothetical protein